MPIPALYRGLPFSTAANFALVTKTKTIPFLVEAWMAASRPFRSDDIVETVDQGFSYLFDLEHERLIAAWGGSLGEASCSMTAAMAASRRWGSIGLGVQPFMPAAR